MRVAAISDIHGNLPALEAVLADIARRGCDQILQLGDALSGPLWPQETADRLRGLDALHVRGNHDVALVHPDRCAPTRTDDWTLTHLDSDTLDWLRGLPRTVAIGSDLLGFHGKPDQEDYYLIDEAPDGDPRLRPIEAIEADLTDARARVLVCGHSHMQRVLALSDGRLLVNDGSVGLPAYSEPLRGGTVYAQAGSPHARYALIDLAPSTVSVALVAVPYDWQRSQDRAAQAGFERWAHWLSGWSRR